MLLFASAFAAEPPPATLTLPPVARVTNPDQGRTTGFKLSVFPGFGIAASPDTSVDGFAIGGFSSSPELNGVDFEYIGSWVGGSMNGFQGATGFTGAGDVNGVQATSGVALATGDVSFGQFSAGASLAGGDVNGIQASSGLCVANGKVKGLQTASVAAAGEVAGVQAAVVSVAQGVEGLQVGVVAVSGAVNGAQIGVANVAGDVRGVQIGLVNVAKSSRVSIGLLNFVGDGLHRVDVWTSESSIGSVALKFGSRNLYTLVGGGLVNATQPWWTFGAGLGVHFEAGPAWIEVDDSVWSLTNGVQVAPGVHNKLRTQVGVDLVKGHLAPFAGVSLNTWSGTGQTGPRAVGIPERADPSRRFVAWPGVHAGVSF